ncbi:hypothetical protein MWU54_00425 [Marivita sp. S6314]|nr:hypothetical protein [Marivita sp. S6314]
MQDTAALVKSVEDADAQAAAIAKTRTQRVIKQAAAEIGHPDLRTIATGRAPYIDLPIIPLPEPHRIAFETHLKTVIDKSFDAADDPDDLPRPDEDPDYATRRKDEQPEPFVYNAACIACQGDCCTLGGDRHGFLTEETMHYIRWTHPTKSRDDILEMYRSYYPEASTKNSCVYHGAQGCTLPRHLRADICNTFQCPSRRALIANHARKPRNGAVVAGLSEDHADDPSAGAQYLRVVSVSASNEVRVHSHLKLPALRPRKTPT